MRKPKLKTLITGLVRLELHLAPSVNSFVGFFFIGVYSKEYRDVVRNLLQKLSIHSHITLQKSQEI